MITEIKIPPFNEWMNPKYLPLLQNKDRRIILYGSRASGKSRFIAHVIILRMLRHTYFFGICVRDTEVSIKETSFKELKGQIIELGLYSLFNITESPLKITCNSNGNSIIFKGLDHPEKLKSLSNPSFLWWEESVPFYEEDYVIVSNSLRSNNANFLQEVFTLNPVIEDYENHWFWKKFFKNEDSLSFRKEFKTIIKEPSKNGFTEKETIQYATILHSTFDDNIYLDADSRASIILDNKDDAYRYAVYVKGIWCNKQTNSRFYKKFDTYKNSTHLEYNPQLALHISWDFNVNPGSSLLISQITDNKIKIIDEIRLLNPNNNPKYVCQAFKNKYNSHNSGLFIYGDASGKAQDTRNERGHNDYTIIMEELKDFKPIQRVPSTNPPIVMRGNFINDIFINKYNDIEILVDDKNCQLLTNDLLYAKEAPDGTTYKEKIKDKDSGITYEKYHHMGDCLCYLLCEAFRKDFEIFSRNGMKFQPSFIKPLPSKNSW